LMEERGEPPKQLSRRKKPGVRIAGHSETSILGHAGRFEYSARQSGLAGPRVERGPAFAPRKKAIFRIEALLHFPQGRTLLVGYNSPYDSA
jgi:hypothetical protein